MKLENILIREMGRNEAEKAYLDIVETLSLEAKEEYAKGVRERVTLGAMMGNVCVGIVSVEIPFPNNANLYWIGVQKKHLRQGVGTALLKSAVDLAARLGASSITVGLLSPKEEEIGTLRPWLFFQKKGFLPLFENETVYLYKNIKDIICE